MDDLAYDSPNDQFRFFRNDDWGKELIFRSELDAVIRFEEAFYGEFAVDRGDDDVAVARFFAAIDDQNIVGKDSGVAHRFPRDLQEESRGGIGNKVLGDVERLADRIERRGWEPRLHAVVV